VVAIYIPLFLTQTEAIAKAIASGAAQVPAHKPVLSVFISSKGAPPMLAGARGALPAYAFPEEAAMALARAVHYGRWRQRARGEAIKLDRFALSTVRAVIDRLCAANPEPQWLSHKDLNTILCAAGIDVAVFEQASVDNAEAVAERLGYPLVAKAVAPDLLHKSDVGGVILDLHTPQAVAQAAVTLNERMRNIGTRLEGIVLQRQIEGGIEALVGVTSDPTFGPLLVCGLGGVMVELLRDVSFRLTPVADVDAAEMLDKLRSAKLLDGYRGRPAGDRAALIDVIMRISALVEVIPELRELDLNPVMVLPPGNGAVVVDGRMRIGAT